MTKRRIKKGRQSKEYGGRNDDKRQRGKKTSSIGQRYVLTETLFGVNCAWSLCDVRGAEGMEGQAELTEERSL